MLIRDQWYLVLETCYRNRNRNQYDIYYTPFDGNLSIAECRHDKSDIVDNLELHVACFLSIFEILCFLFEIVYKRRPYAMERDNGNTIPAGKLRNWFSNLFLVVEF